MESANPQLEYERRLQSASTVKSEVDRLEAKVGNGRVAVFFAGLAATYLVFVVGVLSPLWLVLFVVSFLALAAWHERVQKACHLAHQRVRWYQLALERLEGKWSGTTGEKHVPENHPYAFDLDIFGPGSVFERMCLVKTGVGEATLARWLLAPAELDVIRQRQQAVDELRSNVDLREHIALLSSDRLDGSHVGDLNELVRWGEAEPMLRPFWLRWPPVLLVAFTFATIVSFLSGELEATPMLVALALQSAYGYYLKAGVESVVGPVERKAQQLAVFAGVLQILENEPFDAPLLKQLQKDATTAGRPASQLIARLGNLVAWLNATENRYFATIAPFFLYTTQLAFLIEGWRRICGRGIAGWLDTVGEFEALCALSAYAYENPSDPFPELCEHGPLFDGVEIGHPLIPDKKCVRNSLCLGNPTRVFVVSGSNMSGKSTLLRTVGVNTVLALAGAPVKAKSVRLSPLAIGATMRIQDSLQAGQSRFFAEISRIRQIVAMTQGPIPVLFLLDELLNGTNSHDRKIGAEAIVRTLIEAGAIGLLTTHDLALTHIADQLGDQAANVHFEDQFADGSISFDYVLRPGIVQKSNALALMRAVGLQV
ncbi:MAG: DNA mismatch repair protein [Gemmatales bacterium]|nr:MAG: DNA mismatch repair protein [Gemmatales bacterium]